MYLWPTGSAPTLFRAPSVPSGSGTVALNQGSGSGPVNVYLSWVV